MILHQDKQTFKDLVDLTAEYLSLPSLYIEKDYWVTFLLFNLHNSKYKEDVVFKGGTSLSKVYNTIDRFSEDVDLVIFDNGNNRSLNQNKKLLSKIPKEIALNPLEDLGKEHPDFKDTKAYKKRVYKYPNINLANNEYGHAGAELILEVNFFIEPYPVVRKSLKTYIYDFLLSKNEQKTIGEFDLEPFDVNVLCISRTFYEKVLSVYRASYKSLDLLKSKIRHFYDIYMIVTRDETIKKDIQNKKIFIENLQKVIKNEEEHEMFCDVKEFLPLSNSNLGKNIEELKEKLRDTYEKSFLSMVYNQNKKINFDEVYNVMININMIIKEYKL